MGVFDPINKSLCLEQLCEANYAKLVRLIPGILNHEAMEQPQAKHHAFMHMRILERSPFTLTIELNQRFNQQQAPHPTPALLVRIYLDVKSAEVLRDAIRSDVHRVYKSYRHSTAIMDYKWQLNYFLSKWLDHCLSVAYK